MMQKVLYALAAAALLSLAHGSPVGDETVVVDDSIQNDAELEMMDAMQDQEHVDRDPICELTVPVEDHDDHIPDDFKYFMEEPENNTCNNANDDEEVFGNCWCPADMSCRTQGDVHVEHYCILTSALVSQEEQREDFGDGLLLGGGGAPEIIVSTVDEDNHVVGEVNVNTDTT